MPENETPADIIDLPYADDPELARIKMQPHSVEAEQSVLGGLMLAGVDYWERVADVVQEQDFYRPDHRSIFRQMSRLAEDSKTIDAITVGNALDSVGELESAGGLAYLLELADKTPSASNIRAYASVVSERSRLRHLIRAAQEIADSGYNPEGRDSADLIDEAERRIMQVSEGGLKKGGPEHVDPLLAHAVEHIEEIANSGSGIIGLSTGFTDLDKMTSGLQRSDLVIVAGRPGMGKTSFAMNIVEHVVLHEKRPALVFSMEMPAHQLMVRMLSSIGRINQSSVRAGELGNDDWERLGRAVSKLKSAPLYIDDTPALTPTEIRTRARRVDRELRARARQANAEGAADGEAAGNEATGSEGLGMIMVDYLQLMQVAGFAEGRTAEISEISRNIKALARELDCPVLALSQLNRAVEARTNKRPLNSDLRESGALEQDADLIMFIYREEAYDEDTEDKGIAEIIIGKQRNGPIGTRRLSFIDRFTRFENLALDRE